MALTFTYRASQYTTTAGASYALTSYTPAANSLLVAFVVGCGDNTDPNHATQPFTGHGVTWTKKAISNNALSTTHALSVWVANAGASPTSESCTARWATNRTGAAIIEFEITGWNDSLSAVDALVQAVTNTGTGTSGSFTLSAASSEANRPLAFFVHLANQGTTPRANWTEPSGADGNFNNPATGAAAQYRDDAFETTASASWTTSSDWRGIGLEIAAATTLALSLSAGSLAFTGQTVGVSYKAPEAGTLTVSGHTPSVNVGGGGGSTILIPVGAVTFTSQAPTLSVGGTNPTITPSVGTLEATGQLAQPLISGGTITIPRGSLDLTGGGVSPAFSGPSTGALSVTGQTPVASIGSGSGGGPQIAIPAVSLTASGQYVGVLFSGPLQGTLTFTGYAPEFAGVKPVPVGVLALTGRAPTLDTRVDLKVATIIGSGHTPTVVISAGGQNVAIGIPQGALAFIGTVPVVATAGSATITPSAGSLSLTGRTPSLGIPEQTVIRLFINGENQTAKLRVNTLDYTDDLNARNTLSCELWDDAGTYHPAVGQELILYAADGVTRLFAGTIEEPEERSLRGISTGYAIRISAVDYNQLADRHLVAEVYDNQSFTTIVTDLVTQYLAADGVAISAIDGGPTFVRKIFNYRSVAECLNELSEDTGYAWWIDYDKAFHFRTRESVSAPTAVSLTNSTILSVTVKTSRNAYRNRQYIRAGRGLTDVLTESFTGDGARQTFSVGFPIGTVPTVRVNGVVQTVGIRGVDDSLTFQWYWNKDANEVSQRSSGVPLTTSDTLQIAYRGLYPLLVQAQNDADVAERISIEGGSGLYETIDDYADIDSADLAFATAAAKLQRNGFIRQTIAFETDVTGFASGQLVSITLTPHNVSGLYLIQSVSANDVEGQFLRYRVTAIDGDAVGGWIAFYQQIMAKRRDTVQTDNELLNLLRAMPDVVTASDAFVIDTPVAPESRIGIAQIGRSEIGALP